VRLIFILFLGFFASYSSALAVDLVKDLVKKQIHTDSAEFAREMHWQEYRYSSKLRIPRSLKTLEKCLSPVLVQRATRNAINRVRYKVTCNNTVNRQKWSSNITANIRYYVPVATSVSSLSRGHSLQPEDIVFSEQKIRDNDYYFNIESLTGRKIKRNLRAGTVIQNRDIIKEYAVLRKAEVSIVIKQDSLTLSTVGIALKSGETGESIKVENKRSGNIITTTVIGKNKVEVEVY
jgi:flagella basal body P-ring formation protein FlgA